MSRRIFNFLQGQLGAGLSDTETTITFATAPNIPTLEDGEYVALVLRPDSAPEIVHLVAYVNGALTGTILRGQEGTFGSVHEMGEPWRHGPLVADIESGGGGSLSDRPWAESDEEVVFDSDDAPFPSWVKIGEAASRDAVDFTFSPNGLLMRVEGMTSLKNAGAAFDGPTPPYEAIVKVGGFISDNGNSWPGMLFGVADDALDNIFTIGVSNWTSLNTYPATLAHRWTGPDLDRQDHQTDTGLVLWPGYGFCLGVVVEHNGTDWVMHRRLGLGPDAMIPSRASPATVTLPFEPTKLVLMPYRMESGGPSIVAFEWLKWRNL